MHQRVRRLEERGIITGFHAAVDAEAIGLPLTALISVTPLDPAAPDDVPERLTDIGEIEACHSVAGEESYVLKVRVATPGRPRGPARPHPVGRQRPNADDGRLVDALGGPAPPGSARRRLARFVLWTAPNSGAIHHEPMFSGLV